MTRHWNWHKLEQIAEKLERADTLIAGGAKTSEAIALIGITPATYFRWRKLYSGLSRSQMTYVRELEAEVERLRKAIDEIESQ